MPFELQPPYNIFALIHRDTLLFDPRVMEALEAAIGLTPEEIEAALEAYLEENQFVTGLNGVAAIWKGTQEEYDELATKDETTLYVII